MKETERFLGSPVYSLQTMLRMLSFENAQILPLIPDGIYGPNTYASVRSFQQYYDLPPTGITDYLTWQTIVREFDHLLLFEQPYDRTEVSSDPYIIQAKLLSLGKRYGNFTLPKITGEIDSPTTSALRQIQNIAGLKMTGVNDAHTQLALNGIYLNSLIK